MLINVFGESPFLVIDVMLGFSKSFTKGSLLFIQTVLDRLRQLSCLDAWDASAEKQPN